MSKAKGETEMKRQNMFVTLLTAYAAVLGAGCSNGGKPDGSGTIECTQVVVAPQVGGRIAKLVPQEGNAVTNGSLVAQIDSIDWQLKQGEARAALAVAQAQLDLLLAGTRDEDIQRARDQVREAQAVSGAASADLKRIEQLFEKKSATRKQLDDARAQAERTAAALSGAEQMLTRLLHGSRREEIVVAQALVSQAQARVAIADKAVADCTVRAPADGIVTTRSREEGELVASGAALVTISRLDNVWLSIYVPENRLSLVKLGKPARVRIDGDKKEYEGVVSFVSPEAEFTPKNIQTPEERSKLVYRVKISLRNQDGIFKPGMPADGYLKID